MSSNTITLPNSCRFCGASLGQTLVDLGTTPLCESFLCESQTDNFEPHYPLRPRICTNCFLIQLPVYVAPQQIFTEYAYFSSYSDSWLRHAETYTNTIVPRFNLDRDSQVVEIASNDGYLLQYFLRQGIPSVGIEPAVNVARAAIQRGIPTIVKFFGKKAAQELIADRGKFDLVIGNNVLAQVPDINDFVLAMKMVLAESGVITLEVPHLHQLICHNQFDTIYHEHFFYFSLHSARRILASHGLRVFDVEELPTHGGSLRIFACHDGNPSQSTTARVTEISDKELSHGITSLEYYSAFAQRVAATKRALLKTLIDIKEHNKSIVAYGAPGKGNTLLSYCGIRTDFLDYAVDRNPYKQGKFTPGTHIPIFSPERIRETRPDYILILPWNLRDEIMNQLTYIRDWNGRFIVPIPNVEVVQ